jgi:hypothetical protein
MAEEATCQNGRNRAKSAKMAGYSKSCAKRSAKSALVKKSPPRFFLFFFLANTDILCMIREKKG